MRKRQRQLTVRDKYVRDGEEESVLLLCDKRALNTQYEAR